MNLDFLTLQFEAFLLVMVLMTAAWLLSIVIKNVSIVDIFWGIGFSIASIYYFLNTNGLLERKLLVLILSGTWGLRLALHIFIRNKGKGEDFRYQQFRKDYGEKRYWWFSFFQVFLLQGFLIAAISAPLLGAMLHPTKTLGIFDFIGIVFWLIGFIFEAGGDYQLMRFKQKPENKGKLLTSGFWKYTRHPNYFGDAAVWWGFGIISFAGGSFIPILGSITMTFLLLQVSGVSLLERTLKKEKEEYQNYIETTSTFIPWFPRKK